MIDYSELYERARMAKARREPEAPDPPPTKAVPLTYPAGPLVLDGCVVIYGVPHWFRGQQDIFEAGCFAGSLDGVFFGIDHEFNKPKLGDQDDGSLELHDDDVALSFRLKLQPGHLERLAGRAQASAAYFVHSSEIVKGIRHIRRATLVEVSAVHVGSLSQSHCIVRSASEVRPLAVDAKNSFANDGAYTKVIAALRRVQ